MRVGKQVAVKQVAVPEARCGAAGEGALRPVRVGRPGLLAGELPAGELP